MDPLLKANSFTASAVNRIGDAETNSKSKFRRMEKDVYHRFMKIVQYCQLGEEKNIYIYRVVCPNFGHLVLTSSF